ncbi:hypothetical protein D3C79_940150 [compost metagenome]
MLPRPCRLDAGVERKQVGLLGNVPDHRDHHVNPLGPLAQLLKGHRRFVQASGQLLHALGSLQAAQLAGTGQVARFGGMNDRLATGLRHAARSAGQFHGRSGDQRHLLTLIIRCLERGASLLI